MRVRLSQLLAACADVQPTLDSDGAGDAAPLQLRAEGAHLRARGRLEGRAGGGIERERLLNLSNGGEETRGSERA